MAWVEEVHGHRRDHRNGGVVAGGNHQIDHGEVCDAHMAHHSKDDDHLAVESARDMHYVDCSL